MRIPILTLILLALVTVAFAQSIEDMIFADQPDSLHNDIIKVNFEKKDARKAMLLSALLPGAGQFYADKSAFTTYLFPALELALIGGIVYFNHQGNVKTDEFEKYATGETVTQTFNYTVNGIDYQYTYTGTRYRREYQDLVQNVLMSVNAYDIYDGTFFRLDDENTQHFYEDIGKYDKYIFGWADWYHNFATDPRSGNGTFVLNDPAFAETWLWSGSDDPQLAHLRRWEMNYRIEDYLNGDLDNPVPPEKEAASPWREEYIEMRKAANRQYSYGRIATLGLAFNHIAAAIDAALLTSRYNRNALTRNDVQLYYYADASRSRFTPGVGIKVTF